MRTPMQENPLQDEDVEQQMLEQMCKLMKENDAPQEQFERLRIK